ncbi:MAG: UDP-N-acetylglucosamine 1-carboxyvinyltransferase [Oscillospiraceae bacterium]|nr:UDP-N-acetylglucosamine 1-carboxyvinyltransferase [Oscillospiraceae bacterium]
MGKFLIDGRKKLKGKISVSGAKNAALSIIPAAILSEEPSIITNVPDISDVRFISEILTQMNVRIRKIGDDTLEIDPKNIKQKPATYDLVRRIRASYYLLGAMLGKFSNASVPLPGGCNFGVRPIDQHIKGFTRLGASCKMNGGMISIKAKKIVGNSVYLDIASVGATINVVLAAVKAEGLTVIENAAKEPHVVDLANFLNSMGADVRGAGTDMIKIYGVKKLKGTSYSIVPDQIETGTYMIAAAVTGGDVTIENIIPKHLEAIKSKLEEIGVKVTEKESSIRVVRKSQLNRCNIKTMPHPGFPTDMQPQISALLALAKGTSIISEGVWDNRFRYTEELKRMGANISVDGKIAVIEGVNSLTGTTVKATDLRAGAALVIAALAAQGKTTIENTGHIERGYSKICKKLSDLGANIVKIDGEEPVLHLQKAL